MVEENQTRLLLWEAAEDLAGKGDGGVPCRDRRSDDTFVQIQQICTRFMHCIYILHQMKKAIIEFQLMIRMLRCI